MAEDTNDQLINDLKKEKEKYELELFADPTDEAAKRNLAIVKSALKRYGVDPNNDDSNSKMKDGGMAKGKGGKMYKHNYATGGQVVDHLSHVVGPVVRGQQPTQNGGSPSMRAAADTAATKATMYKGGKVKKK